MNDVLFMNDKEELFDAFNLLQEIGAEEDKKEYVNLNAIINHMKNDPALNLNFMLDGYMIISFCESPDLLEMWRGYGNRGQKFCLGFDEQLLVSMAEEQYPGHRFVLSKCIYDKQTKKDKLKEFLEGQPSGLLTEDNGDGTFKQRIDPQWFIDFVLLALSFKNSGFSSEREFRLIGYVIDRDKKKHRVNNFGITPYYELELSEPVISKFWIGPSANPSMAKYSLDSLINQSNHTPPRIIKEDGCMEFSKTSFRE